MFFAQYKTEFSSKNYAYFLHKKTSIIGGFPKLISKII